MASICDSKLSKVNVSEDRIKEYFVKRLSKQNRTVSGLAYHSHRIAFIHPITGNKSLQWTDHEVILLWLRIRQQQHYGDDRGLVVWRWTCNLLVSGLNPPACH